ncbi:RadC family protein [Gracilimonas mengyeensis]|uniref:DNA replication and repair protein RadC n=1 Tax=Gracilimonas mengyeensis TaxID=1302730 RepID=A0A521CCW1_9BACT|nr:DNA repair protein RadC [Gracilimonas mengyeensis]SMO57267.1 DNA replication and repair protein RadC [Gracilimonas mengyeensis]
MAYEESFSIEDFHNRTVKDMQPDEQPREKLMRYGAESLSDSELLAILLRTGTKKLNVIETAKALLEHFGGLHSLVRKDWQSLKVIPGIAKVKAITLEAAFELARRMQIAELGNEITVTSPEDVNAYFAPKLRHLTKETFIVAFLDNTKKLTGYRSISTGGKTATIVDASEVMRQAVLHEANSIVLVHNHPSGHNKASTADIQLTKRLAECGKLFGIPVEDHVIIAGHQFVSLRSNGVF